MGENIEDYIDRGIHGLKETKAGERKVYLTTLRERVILALTDAQVMKPVIYEPIRKLIKEYPDSLLFLDGELSYSHLSKYIKLANKSNIQFTIVDDLKSNTEIGLVLASPMAIDKEDIFVSKKEF